MSHRTLVVALLATAACGGDPVDAEPLGDYTTWDRVELRGPAPGHGDTLRVVYINDVARAYVGERYDVGSILVKEIYDGTTEDADALAYVAIMRRLDSPAAYQAQGGWLFSESATPGGTEEAPDFCWSWCHAAAPYEGVFLDYSK